jgi:glycosyltransferase involved in cell wall biosynthesis
MRGVWLSCWIGTDPMPTLLSVNNYYYPRGGAEVVFLEHNRMFERLGWSVVPFSMHHPKNLPSPWSEHFIDEIEFGSSYSLTEKLVRIPKVIYSFESRARLAKLLDRVRPDLCHGHNLYHHISPSILGLLRQRGIPTVLTLHDLKLACPAYSMLAPDGVCERCRGGRLHNVVTHRCIKGSTMMSLVIYAEAVVHRALGTYRRYVDRFVVPSRFYIDKFVEWGMPRELFQHVPNFVATDSLRPQFEPGQSFVYVGRLSREKGLRTLVKAAALTGLAVRLIGTGPLREELERYAAQLGANVTLAGFLSGDALHQAVRSARAVVLPSEWYENAPLSVLEAYALGKPVIGARIGGIPELIRENDSGLIFESGNAESLADVMRDIARRRDTDVELLGRNARRWVEAEFSASEYRRRMLDLYRGLGAGLDASTPASERS